MQIQRYFISLLTITGIYSCTTSSDKDRQARVQDSIRVSDSLRVNDSLVKALSIEAEKFINDGQAQEDLSKALDGVKK